MGHTLFSSKAFTCWVQSVLLAASWSILIPHRVMCYSSGAPPNKCSSMTPNHPGMSLSLLDAPYRIRLSKETYVPFEVVEVTIEADALFAGFMLQARDADNVDTTYVGSFVPTSTTKLVCGQHGLTHTSSSLKDSQTFTWRAPLSGSSNVVFRLTVVKNYLDYYVDIRSSILRPTTTPSPTTTTTTTVLTTLETTLQPTTEEVTTLPNPATSTPTTKQTDPPSQTTTSLETTSTIVKETKRTTEDGESTTPNLNMSSPDTTTTASSESPESTQSDVDQNNELDQDEDQDDEDDVLTLYLPIGLGCAVALFLLITIVAYKVRKAG